MMNESKQSARRSFLDWLIGLFSAVTGAAMALPAMMYLWPAARGGGDQNVEVDGAVNMFPGESRMVQVAGKAVILVRGRAGFVAFSASCTHLGCLVTWDGGRKAFLCPCHAAVFDENGGVVSGPPSERLHEYRVKEVGEKVFVLART